MKPMRSREDIEETCSLGNAQSIEGATAIKAMGILEVLLDCRDLLTKLVERNNADLVAKLEEELK